MSQSNGKHLIFLVGVKSTGKSHLARMIARDLNVARLDTDERIADLYSDSSGDRIGVRAIYRIDDGTTFRKLEAIACAEAARSPTPLIVATGGGVCDNAAAVSEMRSGLVLALEAEPEFLFRRIMKHGIPAYMSATTTAEAWIEFRSLHARRQTLYRELSDFTVGVGGRREDEIAAEVRARIEESWDGGE